MRLQLERPLSGLQPRSDLDLFTRVLEAKHLDLHVIRSRRQPREFVGARFVGGGHHVAIALGGGYRRSRQRLATELDSSRVGEASRGVGLWSDFWISLCIQRRTQSQK